ncbi:reverse transcriptase domain-containing protein [Tanacetum coccineum]|uniref:Reverse transcriptase domain-containing protein n=1 Tax=Tanacetum coccineum TaxID=301880 RepID=A0ABQ5FJ19_9ASTR
MYLAVSEESINAVLLVERGKKQIPIYFVSRALKGAEIEYPKLEKLTLALLYAARRLRRKEKETQNARNKELDLENTWKLHTDRAFSFDGSEAGLILVNLEGREYTYALRFEFETTNNKAEYEALLVGLLIAKEIKIEDLEIFVDSQLVENQVEGLFKARQQVIKQYLKKTRETLKSFKSYSMKHVR